MSESAIASELERIVEAYIRMAKDAKYRPAAPGDRCGSVDLTRGQLADEKRLLLEAQRYAAYFIQEEDTRSFYIGCSSWTTNRALVYTIEAARLLCGGTDADRFATKLLAMAVLELFEIQERGQVLSDVAGILGVTPAQALRQFKGAAYDFQREEDDHR